MISMSGGKKPLTTEYDTFLEIEYKFSEWYY